MIAERIHPDNDVDITVRNLPAGLTVTWFASGVLGPTATATHVDVSGTLVEATVNGQPVYSDILEGAAITAHLLPILARKSVYVYIRINGGRLRVVGQTALDPNRIHG